MKHTLQLISDSQALKKGVDLWVVSDYKHSAWVAQIDWLLGFKIRKSRQKKILQFQNTPYPTPNVQYHISPASPLLVDSSKYLPNLWTVQLIYTNEWLDKIYDIWCDLHQPSVRIFTPQPIKLEKVADRWSDWVDKAMVQYTYNY